MSDRLTGDAAADWLRLIEKAIDVAIALVHVCHRDQKCRFWMQVNENGSPLRVLARNVLRTA